MSIDHLVNLSASTFLISHDYGLLNPTGKAEDTQTLTVRLTFDYMGAPKGYQEYQRKVLAACQSELERPLATLKLKALTKDMSSEKICQWLIQRLEKKIPKTGHVSEVEVEGALLVPPKMVISRKATQPPSSTKLTRAFHEWIGQFSTAKENPEILAFVEALAESALRDKQGQNESYLSRQDIAQILAALKRSKATGVPLNFVNFICPPYSKTKHDGAHKNYDSIHPRFEDSPSSYNFDYDYYVPINVMQAVQTLGARLSIPVKSYIVFGDWSLICIDNIMENLKTEERVVGNLSSFFNGMAAYVAENNKNVSMTSFQEIGVRNYLPIGLPFSLEDRLQWLMEFSKDSQDTSAATQQQRRELAKLLTLAESSDVLEALLDWRQYEDVYQSINQQQQRDENPDLTKAAMVETAKVYRSVYELRKAQESFVDEPDFSRLRHIAYVDTLLRRVQYKLFSQLFTRQHGEAVCIYTDPKFSSCGHFFRQEQMAVGFINDRDFVTAINNHPTRGDYLNPDLRIA